MKSDIPSRCHGIDTSLTTAPNLVNVSADALTKSFTPASKLGLKPSFSNPIRTPLTSRDNYSSN